LKSASINTAEEIFMIEMSSEVEMYIEIVAVKDA
jgi:hypothetical protein